MAKLTIYDPIYGGFFFKTSKFDEVRNKVRSDVGESVFKLGYSASSSSGATKPLKSAFNQAQIVPVVPTGSFSDIDLVKTSDSIGNEYHKLRLTLDDAVSDTQYLISVDIGTDVAKRMISKLSSCTPGQVIKVNAWPIIEQKGDRSFINHCVSIRDDEDKEVPALAGLFTKAKESAEKTIASLGLNDKKVIQSIKQAEQTKVFGEQLAICKTMFEMIA